MRAKVTCLVVLVLATMIGGCNAYFVPALNILHGNGAMYCWARGGSDVCANRAAAADLEACLHELEPKGTWRTTEDSARGLLVQCMSTKGWERKRISGEEFTLG